MLSTGSGPWLRWWCGPSSATAAASPGPARSCVTPACVTVDASDTRRRGGYLSRQGPGMLRWVLFEAGLCAARATSPDRDYYRSVKQRHDGKLAAICVARKLARRSYHILRQMEPEVVYAIPEPT